MQIQETELNPSCVSWHSLLKGYMFCRWSSSTRLSSRTRSCTMTCCPPR